MVGFAEEPEKLLQKLQPVSLKTKVT